MSDPFLSVQSDVQSLLQSTRHLFSSYLRIRTLSTSKSTTPSTELLQSQTELTENLSTLTTDIADLLESIRAVETDPYRFGLDIPELTRRKQFVQDVTAEIDGMRKQLSNATAADVESHSTSDRIDDYAEYEQTQQLAMMREQDEALDDVFHTVGNLRGQAEDMGRELEEQGQMLDEVNTVVDRVGGKLQVGTRRIGEVIRRNEDRWSSWCIYALIGLLVFLLFIVIVI